MNQLGKIVIENNKVYFEYYKLKKPNSDDYLVKDMPYYNSYGYGEAMKEYKASKQLIKVSNVFLGELTEKWFYEGNEEFLEPLVKDSQRGEAEVGNNEAIIIKIN